MSSFISDLPRIANKIVASATSATERREQLLIVEGTPRTLWDGERWKLDPLNAGLDTPAVLIPHKLHHVTPDVKLIVILRDPADRLLSDYKFFYKGKHSTEDFNEKVRTT